ncbi:MAG TPA: hypothetical protein VK028_07520, partial [Micromonosporaceae bacterium]|nr:hypothetical protein [Micromonosporaceae bacterium]
ALVTTVLAATGTWNPFPQVSAQLQAWWGRLTALSDPQPQWTVRLGGTPDIAAVMATGEVVFGTRGFASAYAASTGRELWQHRVHWTLPAHDVVVVRLRPENPDSDRTPDAGYSVIDPATGGVIWADHEAQAVWAFADSIVDLTCPENNDCRLRSFAHRPGGSPEWTVQLPAAVNKIRGPNPPLAGTRDPSEWFAEAAAGTPGNTPPLLGLPVDGRIYLVDTFRGTYVREIVPPDRQTRLAVSNDRYLYVHAQPSAAGCTYWVEAFDYLTGESRWREEGFNLDTASGAGCEQRREPLGRGGQLVVTGADNRPRLVRAAQAEETWVGVPGEQVLATDGELALVAGADRSRLTLIDVQRPKAEPIWDTTAGLGAKAAITARQIIIVDRDKEQLIVLSRTGTVVRLQVKTSATLIGYGSSGVVLASGRKVGYLPFRR